MKVVYSTRRWSPLQAGPTTAHRSIPIAHGPHLGNKRYPDLTLHYTFNNHFPSSAKISSENVYSLSYNITCLLEPVFSAITLSNLLTYYSITYDMIFYSLLTSVVCNLINKLHFYMQLYTCRIILMCIPCD